MTYQVNKEKKIENSSYQLAIKNSYPLTSSNHHFLLEGDKIKNIMVVDQKMIERAVLKKVRLKYERLIKLLTNLLISEDDTGTCATEALNLIEKFRLEIKVKYRKYLKEKDVTRYREIIKSLGLRK